MSRQESTITEHGEPSLIYLRKGGADAPIELVIVENGNTHTWTVSPPRTLRMVADGAGFVWSNYGKG